MRNRFLHGTTDENNQLTLMSGELAVDTERKALRLHINDVLGGYEIIGKQVVEVPTFGDLITGFYGEVPGSEFITYEALATEVGLSAGTLVNNDESAWLKYSLDSRVVYVAKKPARYGLFWQDIANVNAVYDTASSASVTINGKRYQVTLLKGAASDPSFDVSGYDLPESNGSEWNRLLYPVHAGDHTVEWNPIAHSDPNVEPFGSWAQYTDADLVVYFRTGDGNYQWTQEQSGTVGYYVNRGHMGITSFRYNHTTISNHAGWRPVLRLIE